MLSAGWYFGRLAALVASSTLLVVLLTESAALYGRLANALLLVNSYFPLTRQPVLTLEYSREPPPVFSGVRHIGEPMPPARPERRPRPYSIAVISIATAL